MTTLPDPITVDKQPYLAVLAASFNREPILAIDTESNSLFAYQEQVCLIQVSTKDTDYLIDPLALSDLSPLGPVFANPGVEKVFHAAEYDLICLKRDYGFEFANLFETMVAARILGREKVGLGNMLAEEYGVRLNKRHQRADWGQRPLPQELRAYARLDTHYLIDLRKRLKQKLESSERWPLAVEDFTRACQVRLPEPTPVGELCWRVNGAYDLTPQRAAVLHELCLTRDREARRRDRPAFKVIGDKTLMAVSETCPREQAALAALPGMTYGQMQRYGRKLLAAVRRGLEKQPLHPAPHQRPDQAFLDRVEALRAWRKHTAKGLGVESDVVLPRDLMLNLAHRKPATHQEIAAILAASPYRLERFGEQILRILNRH